MTAPTKAPLTATTTKHGQAVAAANAHMRGVEHQQAAAEAEVARLGDERIEAFSTGDEAAAARLADQRAEAKRNLAEFGERAAGARRAVQRAEAERAQFATHNVDALVREL